MTAAERSSAYARQRSWPPPMHARPSHGWPPVGRPETSRRASGTSAGVVRGIGEDGVHALVREGLQHGEGVASVQRVPHVRGLFQGATVLGPLRTALQQRPFEGDRRPVTARTLPVPSRTGGKFRAPSPGLRPWPGEQHSYSKGPFTGPMYGVWRTYRPGGTGAAAGTASAFLPGNVSTGRLTSGRPPRQRGRGLAGCAHGLSGTEAATAWRPRIPTGRPVRRRQALRGATG